MRVQAGRAARPDSVRGGEGMAGGPRRPHRGGPRHVTGAVPAPGSGGGEGHVTRAAAWP